MKKLFVFILCCLILFHSCYSLSPFTPDDWFAKSQPPEEKIFITLIDDSVIESQPDHYIYTTQPANFIYGSGIRKHRPIPNEPIQFVGKLERASIDSLKIAGVSSHQYLVCYLPDSTEIYFQDGDYIMVTPDQPAGFRCSGILKVDGKESIFYGRIPNERIKRIEMKKFDLLLTSVVVGGVIGIALIVFIISNAPDMKNLELKF